MISNYIGRQCKEIQPHMAYVRIRMIPSFIIAIKCLAIKKESKTSMMEKGFQLLYNNIPPYINTIFSFLEHSLYSFIIYNIIVTHKKIGVFFIISHSSFFFWVFRFAVVVNVQVRKVKQKKNQQKMLYNYFIFEATMEEQV